MTSASFYEKKMKLLNSQSQYIVMLSLIKLFYRQYFLTTCLVFRALTTFRPVDFTLKGDFALFNPSVQTISLMLQIKQLPSDKDNVTKNNDKVPIDIVFI